MSALPKKSVIVVLIIALFFLAACQQAPAGQGLETETSTETSTISTKCTAHSECVDENYMRFQAENCTWARPEKCDRGCVNGTCKAADVCTTGFKCIDENRRGYQKEDCSYATKINCEWGCWEGRCQEKPTNIFANASEAPAPGPKYSAIAENQEDGEVKEEKTIYNLKVGEQQQIQINGVQTNVSIHFLEPEQVTLKVNGIKSNPIMEHGNTTYENIGATFKIEWILFKSYAGGKQEIGFSVN